MVGPNPKCSSRDLVRRGAIAPARGIAFGLLLPLCLTLAQCGQAPSPGTLAANIASAGDSFDERFPAPQFRDRFPAETESLRPFEFGPKRTVQTESPPYRLASLEPQVPPSQHQVERDEVTTLVGMRSSAFPYSGNNPSSDEPFLNVVKG